MLLVCFTWTFFWSAMRELCLMNVDVVDQLVIVECTLPERCVVFFCDATYHSQQLNIFLNAFISKMTACPEINHEASDSNLP